MKKISILLTASILALGVTVCNAQSLGQAADAAGVNCKDGVCEIAPVGSSTGTTLTAQANPYKHAVPDIEGEWEKDVKELRPHDVFDATQGESHAGVVFSVNSPIKNFKVLSLQFKDIDANGKPVFQVKELYTKEVLRPERRLLVKYTFFGSIPNNGFSYTDSNGKTRYYSISQSGKDGSLLFIEF